MQVTGSRAVASHTGAIAEKSELISAVMKQSHIISANDFRDMVSLARTFDYFKDTFGIRKQVKG